MTLTFQLSACVHVRVCLCVRVGVSSQVPAALHCPPSWMDVWRGAAAVPGSYLSHARGSWFSPCWPSDAWLRSAPCLRSTCCPSLLATTLLLSSPLPSGSSFLDSQCFLFGCFVWIFFALCFFSPGSPFLFLPPLLLFFLTLVFLCFSLPTGNSVFSSLFLLLSSQPARRVAGCRA